ncbi:hypothetical protein [Caulobacter hibisci]|uniref:ShKT domain-containing protein n=1 Tax=Caulobacter hibisci TaxID=2035993 RepID=A0ABS0SYR8_9CAUL|nr:hypothetical protein [Caulobacter hibisci]MBI1684584.1 hypothetical protein [Caulobacter hibisci]
MRRALSALLLVAVLASSAGAQTASNPSPTGAPPAVAPAPPPPLFSPKPPERDTQACKAACARTYYFCRANADDDNCPSEWSRCNVRCTASFTRPTGN